MASGGSQRTYEFVKRKRWADLLVTELTEGINLVLSATCIILYCGPAVTESLGWRDSDLIDHSMLELVISDDRATFHACFQESLIKDSDFVAYLRLRRTGTVSVDAADILCEVKGSPRTHDGGTKLVFVTAKPFPNHNSALLNTFLESKVENEQGQRKLLEEGKCADGLSPSLSLELESDEKPLPSPVPCWPASTLASSRGSETSNVQDPSVQRLFGNVPDMPDKSTLVDEVISSPSNDEESEESRKKKLKKTHAGAEQYVCTKCGRTDSPEWRKGPKGPKTLCNACGLRWAKQVRKGEEVQDDVISEN